MNTETIATGTMGNEQIEKVKNLLSLMLTKATGDNLIAVENCLEVAASGGGSFEKDSLALRLWDRSCKAAGNNSQYNATIAHLQK